MARKTDKKTERALTEALTRVCDTGLASVPGFKWITHFIDYKVDYNRVPASLLIVSVFETDAQLRAARANQQDAGLVSDIISELQSIGIRVGDKRQQLLFDTEEACERDNNGNWQERYGR